MTGPSAAGAQAAAPAQAAAGTPVPGGGPLRICFLGDSFVQGVGDPQYRGWVGRVLAATAAADPARDVTGFNLGVRRDTSADVLARCWDETRRRTAPGADHRLVVSFGSNDAVEEGGAPRVRPADTADTAGHLGRLLAGAADRGTGVLVVGPPPVHDRGAAHLRRLLDLEERLRDVCGRAGVPWIPVARLLAGDPDWQAEAAAGDGAHPGERGYDRLADLVLTGGWHDWLAAPGRPAATGRAHGPAAVPLPSADASR
ncbi:GDSL-type esterase/lipase family protein [Streptomyces sp. NPDC001380]|uniref:GDSL-type esterase/lipase family protein n=1 Tax=Streptomyces sp. NPDC001380 TaxID=3364566 RepID=UPI003683DEA7